MLATVKITNECYVVESDNSKHIPVTFTCNRFLQKSNLGLGSCSVAACYIPVFVLCLKLLHSLFKLVDSTQPSKFLFVSDYDLILNDVSKETKQI